ncbi:hypothetical protein ACFQBY_09775 [Promicromonospora citrea]|uniref:Uncharacterized protein n=1 Tax=Promicromonospora citrea TaxID=43677 RepID=A0A8H9GFE2_9MICO|nr:hypothetical protein [Promicromonospora citrea]NNH53058.1 hypothetical protein [Promicromonospora citrea]GGM11075.1 hypothetical protein GCM10010102_03650 [Promicromonospora citrea]HEV6952579.1 hypothetical protein [Promicromonospora sp.]
MTQTTQTVTPARSSGLASNPAEWAAHRRAVVYSVHRLFPGVDAEQAATEGLGELCRQIVVHGAVDRPAVAWCEAAVAAAARLRAA